MSTATELMRLVVHEITAYGQVTYKTLEQIENLLAAEPEADEPTDILTIAYQLGYQEGKKSRPEPAKKPLSDVEIADAFYTSTKVVNIQLAAFAEGFRQAERKYEIGGDDE